MPVLQKRKNFSIRNNANVRRIIHRDARAEGVTYIDEKGEEHLQPANIVVLAAWTPQNTRLLLLSKIGAPYDPQTGKGTLGRNLTHQVAAASRALVVSDKPLNGFMVSGAVGYSFADFDGDRNLDPAWRILRGGTFNRGAPPGSLPIATFGRTPGLSKRDWGSEWKKASIQTWDRIISGSGFRGDHLAYRQNYMDLDPTYTDKYGDPLLRMTLDWTEHEQRQFEFGSRIATEVSKAVARVAGLKAIEPNRPLERRRYNASQYNTTHIQGGVIMGSSSDRSVLNPWLQHWQVPNLWITGSCAFPQNSSANPTLSIVAITIRAADAIVERYLKHEGPLA
jgi:gluconate 2-dehydrogenase alpha chain